MENIKRFPQIRFAQFTDDWNLLHIENSVSRISIPVDVIPNQLYKQIGIRSHGKGIFYKESVTGQTLGNKRVFWVIEDALILNIVFAWEQAVAKTTVEEKGMIASHRFPMYKAKEKVVNIDFLLFLFLTSQGKRLLSIASPGGAGRNKTLGQREFEKLKFFAPSLLEQNQIALFIRTLDNHVNALEREISLLELYKEGIMQKIFRREISFKDAKDKDYSIWKPVKLVELFRERKERNKGNNFSEVFSVTKGKGVINQIEHLGRSYASSDISNYKVVYPGDLVYTKSPTSNFPYGIIKQNKLMRTGVVSVLYGVFIPKEACIAELIDHYFSSWRKAYNYLNPIVHIGAKNTMNIGNSNFLNGGKIEFPTSTDEIKKINTFLSAIDQQLNYVNDQYKIAQRLKKGFLQKMYI